MGRLGFRASELDVEGLVAIGTFGLGVLLLVFGVDWWWKAMVVGWFVLLPLVAVIGEAFEGPAESASAATADQAAEDDVDAALDALREAYATGDITEAEFERRVERILETESVEEARARIADRERGATAGAEPERTR